MFTNRVSNANVYVNGESWLGAVSEAEVPQLKTLLSEHNALGMVGKIKLPTGLDTMEAKFKFTSYYGNVLAATGNPFRATKIQVRANVEEWNGEGLNSETPLVIHFTGNFINPNFGKFKQHDNVELDAEMNVWFVKVVLGDRVVLEVDVINNIWKVDGVDVLANYRRNLGI